MTGILLAVMLTSAAAPFDAQTLDGRTVSGTLVKLSATGATLMTSGGRVAVDGEKLLTLSQKADVGSRTRATGTVLIELTDGSVVQATQYVVQGGLVRITLVGGAVIESPASGVRTVQFQHSAELSPDWSRWSEAKADSDLIVVRTEGGLDSHKGVLHDVGEDAVRFDLDGEVLPVQRSKIYGLVYRHSVSAELPAAVCRITDASGSQWSVRSLKLGDMLQWLTPAGVTVSEPLESITRIDFSGGKLVYLSDLKPESSVWTPLFAAEKPLPAMKRFYGPRFDRGFDSNELELGGVHYSKGIAVHARTEVVYRLPAGFRKFSAMAGIDQTAKPDGKVRLVVRSDDKVLWEGDIGGNDAPKTIDVDVASARRLTILVDFAGLTTGARLLLCNARIVR
ncbi:MAG: NPCBM/NEW2 domain-containing protein [Planctomycetaceae bacterium]|nr:NPCBM/NEW2 domain-containing protein [Planctomycetaceae bacterium]